MGTGSGVPLNTSKRTALYRLYNANDELLYIGIAFNLTQRYNQHRKTKAWWPEVTRKEICWYETRIVADREERMAIIAEHPRYNIAGVKDPLKVPDLPKPPRVPNPNEAQLRSRLRQAARAAARAAAAKERTRAHLREAVLEAARLGLGPAEISRIIDYQLSEGHVSRVIKGKA
jgi:predicted GIY-YIG superfamily endonuclease